MWDVGIWRTIHTIHSYPYYYSILFFLLWRLAHGHDCQFLDLVWQSSSRCVNGPLVKPSDFPTEIDALFLQPLDSMDLNGSQWISMVWGVIHSWGPVWPRKLRPWLRCIDGSIFLFPTLTSPAPWCPHSAPKHSAPLGTWGPEIWINWLLCPLGISNHKVRVQFAGSDHVYNFNMYVCLSIDDWCIQKRIFIYIYI